MRVLSTAVAAIQRAQSQVADSAARVARAGRPDSQVDLAHEAVTQSQATAAVKANAAVIKTSEELSESLVDILA